ncbi:MAG: galactokinase [Planctomycetota bacterium]
MDVTNDQQAFEYLKQLASDKEMDISGAKVRRSSSRFCLGVEHGDYNGTELFGVGTDRFIWMAYKPNGTNTMRLFSGNFPDDDMVEFQIGNTPEPQSKEVYDTWARFPYGVDHILKREGYAITQGIDAVLYGNIPGGGMSRSASLALNLILSILDANEIEEPDQMKIVDLAQMVENDYIGSPCGKLDQIMILFAKEGQGTHYKPADRSIDYVPLGPGAKDFRIVVMDTGTVRPGLEKSTYKIRRSECEEMAAKAKEAGFRVSCLADIKDSALYEKIKSHFQQEYPHLVDRMTYIYKAQKRFYEMLDAWKAGNIETVGDVFRQDGVGLRDEYVISGPELESMCDIVRTVPGVLGERMLGGGDKGAAGCLVLAEDADKVKTAVDSAYPRSRPDFADKYAVHTCKVVDGIVLFDDAL